MELGRYPRLAVLPVRETAHTLCDGSRPEVVAADTLRHGLIRDQADRDAISSPLMRYRDRNGQDWADIIDFLTMWPDARRQVVRVLAEVDAASP